MENVNRIVSGTMYTEFDCDQNSLPLPTPRPHYRMHFEGFISFISGNDEVEVSLLIQINQCEISFGPLHLSNQKDAHAEKDIIPSKSVLKSMSGKHSVQDHSFNSHKLFYSLNWSRLENIMRGKQQLKDVPILPHSLLSSTSTDSSLWPTQIVYLYIPFLCFQVLHPCISTIDCKRVPLCYHFRSTDQTGLAKSRYTGLIWPLST